MAPGASQFADHIGQVSCGITSYVCRSLSFEIDSKFRCYGHCEMMDFVDQRIDEL